METSGMGSGAPDTTSPHEAESDLPHKCDICSKAFALDLSGLLVEDQVAQTCGTESTAEENIWLSLAPSFGQELNQYLRYCSDRTLGKAWIIVRSRLYTFFDITLNDLDRWSREGCALSREIFVGAKTSFHSCEESHLETWVLGIEMDSMRNLSVRFVFLQLKSTDGHRITDTSCKISFLNTMKYAQHSPLRVTNNTGKPIHVKHRYKEKIPPRIETSPSSALPKARMWLEECINSHADCPKPYEHIPTRLLSLSTTSEGLGCRLYLRLASDFGEEAVPYTALSYCWGGNQVLKLNSFTASRFRTTGIEFGELPPTIADAVEVTLSLGIRHLWVDALCILQDDKKDMAFEIAHVGKIYSAATVTLAIAGASSVHDGFLRHRNTGKLDIRGFEIPIYTKNCPTKVLSPGASQLDGQTGKCRPEPSCQQKGAALILWRFPSDGHLFTLAQASPLYKRAWTFQERLLSPRLLDFGIIQTRWWCPEGDGDYYDRQYTDGLWYELQTSDASAKEMRCWDAQKQDPCTATFAKPVTRTDWLPQVMNVDIYHDQMMYQWAMILEEYTGRNLTFPDDRLPALSTIAQCFHARTGYQYAAGLWMEDMPAALLWVRDPDTEFPERNTWQEKNDTHGQNVYCGPTWSWASVEGRVRGFSRKYHLVEYFFGKVLDFQFQPKPGGNVFGGLISAKLVFSGIIKPASYKMFIVPSAQSRGGSVPSSWTPACPSSGFNLPKGFMDGELCTTDMTGTEESLQDDIFISLDAPLKCEKPADLTTSDGVQLAQTQVTRLDVHLLVIVKEECPWGGNVTKDLYHGLVLYRIPSGDYIRLGTFQSEYLSPTDPTSWAIAQWLESGGEQVITLV